MIYRIMIDKIVIILPKVLSIMTALNAITLAFAIELETTAIKVNAANPGPTATELNNFFGTRTVQEAAREPVRLARLGPDGPTGAFSLGRERPDPVVIPSHRLAPLAINQLPP